MMSRLQENWIWPIMKRNFLYREEQSIRWADLDAYDHVNHAAYLIYMQEMRIRWLSSVNLGIETLPYLLPIVSLTIDYKRALSYPGNIQIELFGHVSGNRSWTMEQVIYSSANLTEVCAHASMKAVCMDPKTQKAIAIPPELLQYLQD